ncbi:MAG: cyclic nucleotide-binding domain-containing protein [Sandaracinaceae bacterium]|nr:cyclic nucleotide-binding domain-containing protein [Sandaracinaceae bacterium]
MPAPHADLATLRRVELFACFDDDELTRLGDALQPRHVPAGEVIVREGDRDRGLYAIVEGSVRVMHDDLHLGTLGVGEHFGELALITGSTRTASVIADRASRLLSLEADAFEAFAEGHPRIAIRLLREVVASSSAHLSRMNETLGGLLRERGLPRRVDVQVRLDGEVRTVHNGTLARALLPEAIDGTPVVAALVNGRPRPLDAPLNGNATLAPLTTAHWEGQRIYRHSLGLALLEAARELGVRVRLGPSLGFAQRVLLVEPTDRAELADALEQAMRALIARDAPLVRERVGVAEAIDYFARVGWASAARLADTTRDAAITLASYGELFVPEHGPFLPSTGRLSHFGLVEDEADLLLVFTVPGHERAGPPEVVARDRAARISGLPPASLALVARDVSRRAVRMTEQQERWLDTLGVSCVGDFNRRSIDGAVGELVHVAEGFHEKSLGRIADALAANADHVRIVCIAGPSSSGKTTFIRRLRVQLQVNGINPKGLGLDDYYVDRDATPRDADGDFDFESLEALRLDLLVDHLGRLARGEPVRTAHFDFKAGRSHAEGGPVIRLEEHDLLMLEGIHGLNPRLYEHLPADKIFRIFVCPLVQLPFDDLTRMHASDLRLLRRIVRDRHGRSQDAAETIRRWPKVRAGERTHIFPYQHHADEVFDTSLVYEVSVLKVFAERYLLEVPRHHDAQATAERLLALLDRWITIYPDHVPPTSILREFIGGSGFTY